MMNRRRFLASATVVGTVGAGGCLSATECGETSNHLYIENQLAEPQEVEVQVMKESDEILSDQQWREVFHENVELSGESHRVVEGVYDEHGTYRTAAEQERGHEILNNRETSDVADCHDQSHTIAIADERVDIFYGVPDHLSPRTSSGQ